jgi:hypothetical protein
MDQCVPHDVEGEDSVFLLTLSWPPETKDEKSETPRKKTLCHKRK